MGKSLLQLEVNMNAAKYDLNEKLKEVYPEGTEISFYIQDNQVNPSSGVILGYWAPYLRVRLHSKKHDVKDVHYSKVL